LAFFFCFLNCTVLGERNGVPQVSVRGTAYSVNKYDLQITEIELGIINQSSFDPMNCLSLANSFSLCLHIVNHIAKSKHFKFLYNYWFVEKPKHLTMASPFKYYLDLVSRNKQKKNSLPT